MLKYLREGIMRRAVVFAHYDKDNIIDDYVIYYLQALKKLCKKIVFVSCCEIEETELLKLQGIADYMIAEKHEEYDFGSYKRGFFCLKERNELSDIDSLIFANDSCYAPLFPFANVFEEMDERKVDFWGITKNKFGMKFATPKNLMCKRPHIQSYFLVFNSNVFSNLDFISFMSKVKKEDCKDAIVINYEIGLYEMLTQKGFSSDVYIKDFYRFNHVVLSLWRPLISRSKYPFLKCSVIRLVNKNLTTICGWEEFLRQYTDYPVELIVKNQVRTMVCEFNKIKLPHSIKILCFSVLAILPGVLKRMIH